MAETANELGAYVCLWGDHITISFDDEDVKDITMMLPEKHEQELVGKLIADPNFWVQFLQSLSSALTINKG